MIIIILILILLLYLFKKYFKIPKIGNLCLITGGVKTGKSMTSVYFARKTYKRNVRNTKIINFFRRLFKKEELELPLFYSNVPVGFDYVEITKDILYMRKKVVPHSVAYIQEASLFADSQLIKDPELNNRLLLFFKLCGHIGLDLVMLDTQAIQDIHYCIKRSVSNYFYIHHSRKFLILPFVVVYLQEYLYNDENSVIVSNLEDIENSLKRVIIPKRIWKYYDSKCFSKLVDNKLEEKKVLPMTKKDSLKTNKIISFRKDFQNLIDNDIILDVKNAINDEKQEKLEDNIITITADMVNPCDEIQKFKIKTGLIKVVENEKN